MLAPACAVLLAASSALPPPPTVVEIPNAKGTIELDHRAHLARRAPCKACHGQGVVSKIQFTREWGHTSCVGCHTERGASTRCNMCHSGSRPAVAAEPGAGRFEPPPIASAPAGASRFVPAPPPIASEPAGASRFVPAAPPISSAPPGASRFVPAPPPPAPATGAAPAVGVARGGGLPVPVTVMLSTEVTETRSGAGPGRGDLEPAAGIVGRFGPALAGVDFSADPFPRPGGNLVRSGAVFGVRALEGKRARIDLLAETGLQHHRLQVPANVGETALEHPSATLPYVGGDVGVAYSIDRGSTWLELSGVVRTTLSRDRGSFAVERCDGGACTPAEAAYSFGGTTVGVLVGIAFDLPVARAARQN